MVKKKESRCSYFFFFFFNGICCNEIVNLVLFDVSKSIITPLPHSIITSGKIKTNNFFYFYDSENLSLSLPFSNLIIVLNDSCFDLSHNPNDANKRLAVKALDYNIFGLIIRGKVYTRLLYFKEDKKLCVGFNTHYYEKYRKTKLVKKFYKKGDLIKLLKYSEKLDVLIVSLKFFRLNEKVCI